MPDTQPIFTIAVGSQRKLGFQLRIKGTRNVWDVSAASQIVLEWQPSGVAGVPQTPLTASSTDPDADWVNGLVVVTGSPADLFSVVQTINCSLAVSINGQIIAEPVGAIEVVPRPGYPEP